MLSLACAVACPSMRGKSYFIFTMGTSTGPSLELVQLPCHPSSALERLDHGIERWSHIGILAFHALRREANQNAGASISLDSEE